MTRGEVDLETYPIGFYFSVKIEKVTIERTKVDSMF